MLDRDAEAVPRGEGGALGREDGGSVLREDGGSVLRGDGAGVSCGEPLLVPRGNDRCAVALTLGTLVILLLAAGVLSAMVGQFQIAPSQVLGAVLRAVGLSPADPQSRLADATLLTIRLPRVLLALLVGAALAAAGTVMQAVFGNPLAEPGVIGISAGAAVGACLAIVSGTAVLGLFTVPLFAFVGAVGACALVYALSRAEGRAAALTMILTGIAVTAVANALIALLVFLADETGRDQIVFWQMGSLNGATWRAVVSAGPIIGVGLVLCWALARDLDLLALGDRAAGHAGVRVERVRVLAVLAAALLTGAAVAYAGIIAFVGLIVPHVLRLVVGPSHRGLLSCSILGGALLVTVADVAARTVVPFADLPIGIFTAVVGGPVFFALIRRSLMTGVTA